MPKRNLILILAIIVAAAGVVLWTHDHPTVITTDGDLAKLRPLAQARKVIQDNYVRSVDDARLDRGSISGMVAGLDEWSTYVPPEMLGAFQERMKGRAFGLGLKVERIGGDAVVIGTIMNSPAHVAGLLTGDHLVSVNGQKVAPLTIEEVQDLLDHGKGTVELAIRRNGSQRSLSLERGELPVESVVGLYRDRSGKWVHVIEGDAESTEPLRQAQGEIAYIRVREFVDKKTMADVDRELRRRSDAKGIVLDLRNNPGGSLAEAIGVVNLFVAKGRIVNVVDRTGTTTAYDAQPQLVAAPTVPLVVLVNGQTASAAEIVAGALWASDRAVLVGTRTRGKGCVQSMFDLGKDLGQINLTTAEYYLKGRMPITRQPGSDTWGVDPHVQALPMHEEELAGLRMRGELIFKPTPETMPASWPSRAAGMTPMFLRLDTQLVQAVGLLRDPQEMHSLLQQAREARTKRLAATQQATEASD